MTVLRVYGKAECDEHGVPLDWERCRSCGGTRYIDGRTHARMSLQPCPTCAGYGSLKAAALAYCVERQANDAR